MFINITDSNDPTPSLVTRNYTGVQCRAGKYKVDKREFYDCNLCYFNMVTNASYLVTHYVNLG